MNYSYEEPEEEAKEEEEPEDNLKLPPPIYEDFFERNDLRLESGKETKKSFKEDVTLLPS